MWLSRLQAPAELSFPCLTLFSVFGPAQSVAFLVSSYFQSSDRRKRESGWYACQDKHLTCYHTELAIDRRCQDKRLACYYTELAIDRRCQDKRLTLNWRSTGCVRTKDWPAIILTGDRQTVSGQKTGLIITLNWRLIEQCQGKRLACYHTELAIDRQCQDKQITLIPSRVSPVTFSGVVQVTAAIRQKVLHQTSSQGSCRRTETLRMVEGGGGGGWWW